MNDKATPTTTHSRRRHERVRVRYTAELTLDSGQKVSGSTLDLSLLGVFFTHTDSRSELRVGSKGKIRLLGLNDNKDFACRVIHVNTSGCGLMLTQTTSAGFGVSMTDSLMQEIQSRIGLEIDSKELIRIRWHNPAERGALSPLALGWLAKVSTSNLEFGYPLSSGWNFKMGDSIQIELVPARQPPFPVHGLVRMILSGDPRCQDLVNDRICVLILKEQPGRDNQPLRELIRDLHARRLQRMMTQRSTSLALHSGADPAPRSRPETRRDLERFYGFRR
ncbi:MAG: hypothetical protein G8237_06440 [Magnetococcales bacterium]|nr:hypothetical protein [Magnetococcales bacterium]